MTNFSWSAASAGRKLGSDLTLNVGIPFVNVSKPITGPHNPKTDAYRACSHCNKHINYHTNGKCPT